MAELSSKAKIGRSLGVIAVLGGSFLLFTKGKKLLSGAKMKFALIGFKIHKFDKSGLKFTVTLRCYNPTHNSINLQVNGITAMYAGSPVANSLGAVPNPVTIAKGQTKDIIIAFEVPYLTLFNKGLLSAITNTELFKSNLSFGLNLAVNGEAVSTTQTLSNETTMGTLGLVSGPRDTQNGSKYNHLIKKVTGRDIFIKNGGVDATVEACIDIVAEHYREVEDLAKHLQGNSVKETCKNIFNFAYPYLQYTQDKQGVEQLRTPARSWYDGQIRFKQQGIKTAGIDCDDFAIFCGSLLKCLNIPFKFRITEYDNKGYYQHIYVFVPAPGDSEGEIVIDPVLDKFDYQVPFSGEKSTFDMTPVAVAGLGGFNLSGSSSLGMPIMMLSGVDEAANDDLMGIISGIDFDNAIEGLGSADDATLNYLKRTQRYITKNPASIAHIQNPTQFLEMVNTAIKHWHTDKRDKVLDKLIEIEDKIADAGLINLDSTAIKGLAEDLDDDLGDLGRRKIGKGRFFRSIKKVSKKAGKGLKKAAKAVVRFNPLTLAMRGGLLAALRLNMFKFSSKLVYAYLPESSAAQYNLDPNALREIKKAHAKLLKLFKGMQGKDDKLKAAIIKGSKVKSKADFSLKGLGEPVTAASVTAASGILAKIGTWLKPVKNIFKKRTKTTQPAQAYFPATTTTKSAQVTTIAPTQQAIQPTQAANTNTPIPYQQPTESTKKGLSKKAKKMIFGAVGVALVGGAIYYFSQDNETSANSNSAKKKQTSKRSLGSIKLN